MSGQLKQLYHCDRCGQVFRSSIKDISELKCTECGISPVRDGFAQLAQMPVLDHSLLDQNHGIAGKDEADFFSMERKKKQKRAINMYISWFALLLTVMLIGYFVKKSHDGRETERDAINKESIEYERRSAKALIASLRAFQDFSTSNGENEKAQYIYNGTDYLVQIRNYYDDPLNKEDYKNKRIKVLQANLVEEQNQPNRMDVLLKIDYEDRYDEVFEAVFWQRDSKWYLDWPQFTRIGELNWANFVKNPQITGEYQFRLYARKRRNEFADDNGYTELVLSKAINLKDKSSEDSTSSLVKRGAELEAEVLEYIEQVYKTQRSKEEVLGIIDTVGQARVNVRVAHEEVDGVKVIVLKELISKNWFSELDEVEE